MAGWGAGAAGSRRERLLRGALPIAVALAALSPGPAQASATSSGKTSITPLLDCVQRNSDGSYTAVVGYTSSYPYTTTIPLGPANHVSPSRYDGEQPTTFAPGTRHGAFAVTVSGADATSSNPTWYVDGATLSGSEVTLSASCPLPTRLPAEGNGTGAVVALLVSGAVGLVLLVQRRRRARAAVPATAPELERVDA